MPSPKISVIVPVFNTEEYLHRCIDSILSQTYTDFELLLINDGSKDRSGEICEEYAAKDPRVRVFHKENGGVSSARNLGLDNASGEWITFIDADDEIHNLEIPNNSKQHDIIIGSCLIKENDGFRNETIPEGVYENSGLKYIYSKYLELQIFSSCCCKLYRRSLIGNLRFNKSYIIGEDTVFSLSYLGKVKRINVIPSFQYIYNLATSFEAKYKLSADESVTILSDIHHLYKNLNCRNKIFERNVYFAYLLFCRADVTSAPQKWFHNKTIFHICMDFKGSLSWRHRLKFILMYSIMSLKPKSDKKLL